MVKAKIKTPQTFYSFNANIGRYESSTSPDVSWIGSEKPQSLRRVFCGDEKKVDCLTWGRGLLTQYCSLCRHHCSTVSLACSHSFSLPALETVSEWLFLTATRENQPLRSYTWTCTASSGIIWFINCTWHSPTFHLANMSYLIPKIHLKMIVE